MSTLLTIPSARASHLPTPTAAPIPLSAGDLVLALIPAQPPMHPSDTLTLSVAGASFPLLPISPVRRVKAQGEHATYQFAPVPTPRAAGVGAGASAAAAEEDVGQVRIEFDGSKSQDAWDATEALCKQFESLLRAYKIWDEQVLFVNDEYTSEGRPPVAAKGWGETIAETLAGGASFVAGKISGFADGQLSGPPGHPQQPTAETAAKISAARNTTADLAVRAEDGAVAVGDKVHEAGKSLGASIPDGMRTQGGGGAEDKGEAQKMAEEAWRQTKIAAGGVVSAVGTVAGSASENVHRAVEHKYGTEADRVAQDIGQTGANLGSAALSATKATSVAVQGANVASGASKTA